MLILWHRNERFHEIVICLQRQLAKEIFLEDSGQINLSWIWAKTTKKAERVSMSSIRTFLISNIGFTSIFLSPCFLNQGNYLYLEINTPHVFFKSILHMYIKKLILRSSPLVKRHLLPIVISISYTTFLLAFQLFLHGFEL